MTPEAAIHRFMSGFGIPAYTSTSVPEEREAEWLGYPYLTYTLVVADEWGAGEVSIPVDLWYRTDSEAQPNAKVREISRAIGDGGTLVPCDGGVLWIKKGSPWAQAVRTESGDEKIKRRYLNVDVEYLLSDKETL